MMHDGSGQRCFDVAHKCMMAIYCASFTASPMSMSRQAEAKRVCRCSKCLQVDPDGCLVSAKTFRLHQLKRSAEDMMDSWESLSRSQASSTAQTLSSNCPEPLASSSSHVHAPTSTSASATEIRLEVQRIRYEMLSLGHGFRRPHSLDFLPSARPRLSQGYCYRGIYNQAPYALIVHAPANIPFLRLESQLHVFSERLLHLQSLPQVQNDNDLQRVVQSCQKDVHDRLNSLFTWKVEIDQTLRKQDRAPLLRPVVDTSKVVFLSTGALKLKPWYLQRDTCNRTWETALMIMHASFSLDYFWSWCYTSASTAPRTYAI